MPQSRGDAAGAPRGDLEIAAAPAPVAPAAARFGSAKSRTDVSTGPSSCTSEEDDAARRPATDPTRRVREDDAGGEHPGFSGRADSTKTKHADAASKPVTPETARRREVIARAMAVAAAAAEAKAAAQVLAAKEARAAAARRATARIRGETSPEKRDEKKENAPLLSADASRSGALVLGTRVSPSKREKDENENVATYTTRAGGRSTRRSATETVRDEENDADADPLADAARKLWGGLWGDSFVRAATRDKEPISGGSSGDNGSGSHRSGAGRAATSRVAKGKGATAARRALDAAKKRAHAAQVASARLADASGITGWSCDEESFLPYESPDGPFLPGAETRTHAPSFGDAPRPAPRDWSRVKARVVSRRNADEEE